VSQETNPAGQQAGATDDIFQEPQSAQHRAGCSDWAAHNQGAAASEGGQILYAETNAVGLALDDPMTRLVQVRRYRRFR
jgi:hypothetical protein